MLGTTNVYSGVIPGENGDLTFEAGFVLTAVIYLTLRPIAAHIPPRNQATIQATPIVAG
jgi:hypothetical protein